MCANFVDIVLVGGSGPKAPGGGKDAPKARESEQELAKSARRSPVGVAVRSRDRAVK
jgi:hypothetical protein